MALEELSGDIRLVVKDIPEILGRLQARSGTSPSLCMSIIGQQIAYSLVKNFSSKDLQGILSELGETLEKNKLGSIVVSASDPYSFKIQGCIGCEGGVPHGSSLRCQLLTRIFEASLEEKLNTSCVVKWVQGREGGGEKFNCDFKVRVL